MKFRAVTKEERKEVVRKKRAETLVKLLFDNVNIEIFNTHKRKKHY